MMGERVSWSSRIANALVTCALNIAVWVVVPYFIWGDISKIAGAGGSPIGTGIFSLDFIYAFGSIITGLEVLGALTQGMAISVPFVSGGYLASALFIYDSVEGGNLALQAAGVKFVISFVPLLFLLMIPSLFSALKQPITFLLEKTEAGREAPDTV